MRRAVGAFLDAANAAQRRQGLGLPRAARGRRAAAAVRRSATTPTSTRRSSTRPTSAACSAPTTRCCPTTSSCRSAITAAPRPSSPSGTPVRRPNGQTRAEGAPAPVFGPTARLDYELEVGVFVGPGNALGSPVADRRRRAPHGRAVPGERLVRARRPDVGVPAARPVPRQELRHDRVAVGGDARGARAVPRARLRAPGGRPRPAAVPRLAGEPRLRRLRRDARGAPVTRGAMREAGCPAVRLSRSNLSAMYWTFAQMVAHHTSNGCNLRAGDLLASGTVSGPDGGLARLPARTARGAAPTRSRCRRARRGRFLEDGDEVVMRGWCAREGYRRIGFGECRGDGHAGVPARPAVDSPLSLLLLPHQLQQPDRHPRHVGDQQHADRQDDQERDHVLVELRQRLVEPRRRQEQVQADRREQEARVPGSPGRSRRGGSGSPGTPPRAGTISGARITMAA